MHAKMKRAGNPSVFKTNAIETRIGISESVGKSKPKRGLGTVSSLENLGVMDDPRRTGGLDTNSEEEEEFVDVSTVTDLTSALLDLESSTSPETLGADMLNMCST